MVLSGQDLVEWRDRSLAGCSWIYDLWFEVASQIEMFLAEDVDVFIDSSRVSSWSMQVVKRRIANERTHKLDRYVLQVLNEHHAEIMKNHNIEVKHLFTF